MLPLAAALVLVAVFALVARRKLALGILLGVGLGGAGLALAEPLQATAIPLWLPPLPFALIALALFCCGFFAWFWGPDR